MAAIFSGKIAVDVFLSNHPLLRQPSSSATKSQLTFCASIIRYHYSLARLIIESQIYLTAVLSILIAPKQFLQPLTDPASGSGHRAEVFMNGLHVAKNVTQGAALSVDASLSLMPCTLLVITAPVPRGRCFALRVRHPRLPPRRDRVPSRWWRHGTRRPLGGRHLLQK